jgi:hypothetical protein
MCLGKGGEAYQEIASLGAELACRRCELQSVVLSGDDAGRAQFFNSLSEEELEVLGLEQRSIRHHPDDYLSIVGDGRVPSIAVDGVYVDVCRELDKS